MDAIDERILTILESNSRTKVAEIARRVRLSKETVNYRINRLLTLGHISNTHAIINASKLGYHYYHFHVSLNGLDQEMASQVVNFLKARNCSNIRVLAGSFNLAFLAIRKNLQDVSRLIEDFSNRFGINDYRFGIVMKSYKHCSGQDSRSIISLSHKKVESIDLDDVDAAILTELTRNSRSSLVELGKIVDRDPRLVQYRIRRLEQSGVIAGYSIKRGKRLKVGEYMQIDIRTKRHSAVSRMIESLDVHGASVYTYENLGSFDLTSTVFAPNGAAFRKVLLDMRENFKDEVLSMVVSPIIIDKESNWSPFSR